MIGEVIQVGGILQEDRCICFTVFLGGIKGLVLDGKTGILIPPGDEKALQGAIERMMDDKEGLERMKESTDRWLEQNRTKFDAKEVCERYSKLFERIVG